MALILHRPFDNLPASAQAALQQLRRCDPLLSGRKIVVIDDDIRNIFSLTSALEEHGVELHYAESGRSGIELLQRMPDADAVLVDIMMPGMDGYETIQEIRRMPGVAALPIIAVTAKAMKGDRQKCIEAGASDYIAKPVDIDQLVSVLRVWFQRSEQRVDRAECRQRRPLPVDGRVEFERAPASDPVIPVLPAEPVTPAQVGDVPKAKILIVDDDERTTLAVSTVLEDLGQTLVVAHSGEEALRHLLHDDFAVILLDLHMPGMDGYETAALIRARKRTRHIPIVFLTAVFRDNSHLLQAYSAGAVDMVFKPVDPFILRVEGLGLRRSLSQAGGDPARGRAASPAAGREFPRPHREARGRAGAAADAGAAGSDP